MANVRVRFAPSPTGFLHIGGVRTALFNWLFARQNGGAFVLRIDDTDQQRHVEAALAPILAGLRWLGIDWDEGPEVGGPHGPYFQSQRGIHYKDAVNELVRIGAAYHDYATPDEIAAERNAAEGAFSYSRRWMATTDSERRHFESQGRTDVIRLKVPREGKIAIRDLVRGDVEFDWAQEQDHVIQRADKTSLYSLATVVDDQAFGITHVIRGEEHLSNTARQLFIARSLGYAVPQYAHLPYVAEPGSRQKLSKRRLPQYLASPHFSQAHKHGLDVALATGLRPTPETFNPIGVSFYADVGYIPDAIVNYLVLLGWSLDGKTEFFTRAQLVETFSLDRVSRAPASFDPAKLLAFQAHYMRETTANEKLTRVIPYLERAGLFDAPLSGSDRQRIGHVVEILGDRLKVFGDILLQGAFIFIEDVEYDVDAVRKWVLAPGASERLVAYGEWLKVCDSFESAALERGTAEYLGARGLRLRDIVHAVRVAVTGTTTGPSLFDCLSVLGREACVRRIERALEIARSAAGRG